MMHFPSNLGLAFLLVCGLGWSMLAWSKPADAESFEAGLNALRASQAARARDIWTPLAEAGDAAAQFNLAKLYEQGDGEVGKNVAQAVKLYQQAADQGLPAAQNNLGLMHAQGRGTKPDHVRAVGFWRAAAEQNYPLGQYNLALAYLRGEGVGKDHGEAVLWFRRAADNNVAPAQFLMGQLHSEGLLVEKDPGRALDWYQRAAKQGHVEAAKQAQAMETAGVVGLPEAHARVTTKKPVNAAPKPAAKQPAAKQVASAAPAPAAPVEASRSSDEGLSPAPEPPILDSKPVVTETTKDASEAKTEPVAPLAPKEPNQTSSVTEQKIEPEQQTARAETANTTARAADGVVTKTAAVPSSTGSGFAVQLAAYHSADDANRGQSEMESRFASLLANLKLNVKQAEVGGVSYFRLRTYPIGSRTAASELCSQLKVNGQDCIVVPVTAN